MSGFIVRILNVVMIIAIIIGYNSIVADRQQEEQLVYEKQQEYERKLRDEQANGQTNEQNNKQKYADGKYAGVADGFGGSVNVEVEICDGNITSIEVVKAEKEDQAYLLMAKDIIPTIIEKQTSEVDTISGATFSSTGIKNAVSEALKEATQ